jgi:hypothetical protein
MTLPEAALHRGAQVIWHPRARGCEPGCTCSVQRGVIDGVSSKYVFVLLPDRIAKCDPADLTLAGGEQ